MRFGEKNNLNFAVPKNSYQMYGEHIYINKARCAALPHSLLTIFFCSQQNQQMPLLIFTYFHSQFSGSWDLVGGKNMSYNIFCLHARFQFERINNLMGNNPQTVYITMIRDPVDIFMSAWNYYKFLGEDIGKFKNFMKY